MSSQVSSLQQDLKTSKTETANIQEEYEKMEAEVYRPT